MDNIITYTEHRLDTLAQRPFCPVDSLILSWFSYLEFPEHLEGLNDWNGIRLGELFRAEHFAEIVHKVWGPENTLNLFIAMCASPRFRNFTVKGYVNDKNMALEKQFSAMALQLTPDLAYVAFRGTDSTILGWKEDFNMAFQCPIPSQQEAVDYLNEAAKHLTGRLLVGGHSKGGNLAVYATMMCKEEVRQRVDTIFSHDGPGFQQNVLDSAEFARIAPLIRKTVPQSSIVGMLFEHHEDYQIVESTSHSFTQHDPFTWVIEDDAFVREKYLTPDAVCMDVAMSEWLEGLTNEERSELINTVFHIFYTTDAESFGDIWPEWRKNVPMMASEFSKITPRTRKLLFRAVRQLASLSAKSLPEAVRERLVAAIEDRLAGWQRESETAQSAKHET